MWCAWRWRCLRCSVFDGLCSLGFFFFVNLWVCLYKQLQSCDPERSLTHSACAAPPTVPSIFIRLPRRHFPAHISHTLPLWSLLSVPSFISIFFPLSLSPSVRVSAPPSHLLPFSPSPWGLCALLSRAEAPRPLCPALWLAERKPHGWKEWAAPAPLSAQLFGCSNGITLQLQWEESRGRERHSERGERRRAQNGHG